MPASTMPFAPSRPILIACRDLNACSRSRAAIFRVFMPVPVLRASRERNVTGIVRKSAQGNQQGGLARRTSIPVRRCFCVRAQLLRLVTRSRLTRTMMSFLWQTAVPGAAGSMLVTAHGSLARPSCWRIKSVGAHRRLRAQEMRRAGGVAIAAMIAVMCCGLPHVRFQCRLCPDA